MSVCPFVSQQNPSTAWNHHPSSFIFHPSSSFIILHHPTSSFIILHHHSFISRLLSFSACSYVNSAAISCFSRCISCHDKFCWWSMTRLFSDETNCCQTKMMSRLLRCVGGSHVWWPGSMVSCLPSHMWQCSSSDSQLTIMLLMATIRWSTSHRSRLGSSASASLFVYFP